MRSASTGGNPDLKTDSQLKGQTVSSFNSTPSPSPAEGPATSPRRTLQVVTPDLADALTVDQQALELLAEGNRLAVEIWEFGYRAGRAAERARAQMAAADFGKYLGPEPRLPNFYQQPGGAR